MGCGMCSSLPGLYPLAANNSTPPNCDNEKHHQTLAKSPWWGSKEEILFPSDLELLLQRNESVLMKFRSSMRKEVQKSFDSEAPLVSQEPFLSKFPLI